MGAMARCKNEKVGVSLREYSEKGRRRIGGPPEKTMDVTKKMPSSPFGSPVRSRAARLEPLMPKTPDKQAPLPLSVQRARLERARLFVDQATDDGFHLALRELRGLSTPEAAEAAAALQRAPRRLQAQQLQRQQFAAIQEHVLHLLGRALERLDGSASAAAQPLGGAPPAAAQWGGGGE